MKRVDIKLVREFGIHHLSVGYRDIWLEDNEIKALECILKDYNADPNNFKRRCPPRRQYVEHQNIKECNGKKEEVH